MRLSAAAAAFNAGALRRRQRDCELRELLRRCANFNDELVRQRERRRARARQRKAAK